MENSKILYAQKRDFDKGGTVTQFNRIRVNELTEKKSLNDYRYARKYENYSPTPEPLSAPLKFTAVGVTSTINLKGGSGDKTNVKVYKSTDATNWTEWDYEDITLNAGESIYIKGDNKNGFSDGFNWNTRSFQMTGKLNCEGDIMSLVGDYILEMPNEGCFAELFYDCASLLTAPRLNALNITKNGYGYIFMNCTSLTATPEIVPTTLTKFSMYGMFMGCSSLTNIDSLDLEKFEYGEGCFYYMFQNCTSLVTPPLLKKTTLEKECYYGMFSGCTALTTAPELPAIELKWGCYEEMFKGCTSLTTAPDLVATTLTTLCYMEMFRGCSSLNYVKCLSSTAGSTDTTQNWLNDVAETGTFVKAAGVEWTEGATGIPANWTVEEN